MLPPPTTRHNSCPAALAAATSPAMLATVAGSIPNWLGPINASPDSFSRMRLKRGRVIGDQILLRFADKQGRMRSYGAPVPLPTDLIALSLPARHFERNSQPGGGDGERVPKL